MKKLSAIVGLALLTACVTDSPSYLPDGSQGQLVTCGGALFAYSDCLKRAGDICGADGYKIITSDGNATPYSSASGGWSANSMGGSGGFNASSGVITNRSIMIRCNDGSENDKPVKRKSKKKIQAE